MAGYPEAQGLDEEGSRLGGLLQLANEGEEQHAGRLEEPAVLAF